MLGKTNSNSIGGGAVATPAAYSFIDTSGEASFPREALTEDFAGYFYGISDESKAALRNYLENGNEVAYWGSSQAGWNVLQNSETWSGSPLVNANIAFCFAEPVIPESFHSRIGSIQWTLCATNDWDVFTAYLADGASAENMVTMIADGSDTNVVGGVDTSVGDGSTAYKYYVFKYMQNYANIYNLGLNVLTGSVRCTLKSVNMTPAIKAYPSDYMRLITQPWYDGENIVDSQELILKPYADGGNTVNYTDDGSAVNLKMYLLSGAKPLYILSPDGAFTKPEGYSSAVQVADLDIPAHLYPTTETVSFEQPVLTVNGTLGNDKFAVAADSEIDTGRQAWKAFDGNTVFSDASVDQWHSESGQPHWIAFYNPELLKVTKITIFNGAENVLPLDWQFQYSDDNNEWVTLESGTNTELSAGAEWSFDVVNSGNHNYYRFYTTSGSGSDGSYLGICEIKITGTISRTKWVIPVEADPSVLPGVETE